MSPEGIFQILPPWLASYFKVTHGDAWKVPTNFPFPPVQQVFEYVKAIEDIVGPQKQVEQKYL
jgi:hypothetical protein